ncbi:5'-3' exonuclease [Nocardia takedensis]|uniref:5'-3' exonuclease n=1 Tax=Nocardia takedensis TaxID=259390 RepID=UPI003F75B336
MTAISAHEVPLLLVDGHNLLFRACFGSPAEIYSRDEPQRDITTQFMFPALLRKGINDELAAWPEVIVVFDGQHGTAERKQTDANYKAQRPDPAATEGRNPIEALADIKMMLDLYTIAWIEIDDAEADDVIATLVAGNPHRHILINSMDQDFYQLLRDPEPGRGSVRVLNTAMRPGHRLIGPTQVHARYGITPTQFADYRALCGDTSDNIPGVKGIGAKTAAALLSDGMTLEDLEASGRLTHGTKAAAITAAWDQVLTWREMIRTRENLTLPLQPTGRPTHPLPVPGEVIDKLGLWGTPPTEQLVDAIPVGQASLW